MNSLLTALPWLTVAIGAWSSVNGVLHDIFVLASGHGKKYDRNLLRLLMDGHVLITCGVVLLLCYSGIKAGQSNAYYIAIACCASLALYCAMIWPFLKSVATMSLSLILLALLITGLIYRIQFPL